MDLPSPTDILVRTLLWLGVPFLLVLSFSLILFAAEWIKAARVAGEKTQKIIKMMMSELRNLKASKVIRLLLFICSQALLLALIYSSFRLAHAMGVSDSSGRNIADGKSFTWQELWMAVTEYSFSAELPIQASCVAAGWILALNLAHLIDSRSLIRVVDFLSIVAASLCILGATLIGLIGVMVLSLATWMHHPAYNIGMVSLYAAWVVLLAGIATTLFSCAGRAAEIYKFNKDTPK